VSLSKVYSALKEKINAPLSIPPEFQQNYIPSLDGLRALSIIIVLFSHLRLTAGSPSIIKFLGEKVFLGDWGVQIFFVISGFLITGLLLKEKTTYGTISLKNFYIKRTLRIFPVFYLYLGVIFVLNKAINLNVSDNMFFNAAFYIMNFNDLYWFVGHSWSLSVEEQFYLLWPILLYIRGNRYLWFIGFVFIYNIFLRSYFYLNNSDLYNTLLAPFMLYAPALMAGSLLSVSLFKGWLKGNSSIWNNKYLVLALLLAWVSLQPRKLFVLGWFSIPFDYIVSSLFISIFLLHIIISKNNTILFRIFNHPVVIYLGIISYSLYIWQQLFLVPIDLLKQEYWWTRFPLNIICALIVASLSYFFIEKPILRLKKHIRKPEVQGKVIEQASINRVNLENIKPLYAETI
jgi:peptidoglycan/LPS O-acetylase OafA/YrhL